MRAELLLAMAVVAAPAVAQESGKDGQFEWTWALLSGNSGTTLIAEPRLADGADFISASTGTFTETDSGGYIWELDGEFRAAIGNARIAGSRSRFEFNSDKQLIRGRISGQPVSLSAVDGETGQHFDGSAESISITRGGTGGQTWTLEGRLRAELDGTALSGDHGSFEFSSADELIHGSISGQPVRLAAVDSETSRRFSGSAESLSITRTGTGSQTWRLDGGLRAELDGTELDGSSGSFEFNRAGELIRGLVSGQPVRITAVNNDTSQHFDGRAATVSITPTGAVGQAWAMTGGLDVSLGSATLTGDHGSFDVNDSGELIRGRIAGQPVSLSDYDAETDRRYAGRADEIIVDAAHETVQLLGRTVLSVHFGAQDSVDYEGCDWIYNWNDHSFRTGMPDCGMRLLLSPLRDDETTESPSMTP